MKKQQQSKKRPKQPLDKSSSDDDPLQKKQKPGDGPGSGGEVAELPKVQEPPKRKRKLEKELWDKGTEPSVEKNQLFPNADRGFSNDTIQRKGYTLPVPVDPYELEQNANYRAKLKKKEDQEKQEEKEKIAKEWDTADREYDPEANIYKDIEPRSDYAIFSKYNHATRSERGVGDLANTIDLKFFDYNAFKTDYTVVYVGRRGSGKTFAMRWDLYGCIVDHATHTQ